MSKQLVVSSFVSAAMMAGFALFSSLGGAEALAASGPDSLLKAEAIASPAAYLSLIR
jgi:hypothetical protein